MPQKKLYEIIIESIQKKIENNDFSFESPICTESQLMEEFHVSRITAKRAITELEYQGILYRKRGVGSFVARDIFHKQGQVTAAPKVCAFVLPFTIHQENIFRMISKINGRLSTSNCFLSLFITDGSKSKEQTVLKQLLEQNVSGVLYYPISANIHLDLLNQFVFRGIPVIVLDQPVTAPYLYNVLCDNFSGGKQLTEHLISLGHQKISFFAISNLDMIPSVAERLGGYLKAMKDAELPVIPELIVHHTCMDDTDSLKNRLLELHNAGATGIICENDGVAQALIEASASLGLSVPQDISICGFSDDFDHITSIYQNEELMAEHVGEIFYREISGLRTENRRILVPAELHAKDSTGVCLQHTVQEKQ